MFRRPGTGMLQVLLVHPGGPFWANKDLGAWTIPKGHVADGEALLETAQREFEEETGHRPSGPYLPLAAVRQKSGKLVHAWAFEGDLDPALVKSNTCSVEWPPRSGKQIQVPEVDRAEFFDLENARQKINPAQVAFLAELERLVRARREG